MKRSLLSYLSMLVVLVGLVSCGDKDDASLDASAGDAVVDTSHGTGGDTSTDGLVPTDTALEARDGLDTVGADMGSAAAADQLDAHPDAGDTGAEPSDMPGDLADVADSEDTALPTSEEIEAMTFNLRLGVADDGDDSWEYRKTIVTDLVQAEQPAVMGVQEAWKFQLDYITETVPGYAWVGVSRINQVELDEYSAVFYWTDLFSLVDTSTFWLSDTPDEPASKLSESQCCPRIVTWACLESLATGRILYVFNTHLDTTDTDDVPERSAALIVAKIAEIAGDAEVILTGDFNEPVGSDAYRILTGALEYDGEIGTLHDPWVTLGLAEEGSFHGFTGVATGSSRIDWVLATSGLVPVAGSVIHYEEGGSYPSDHFPVTATFSWDLP